MGQPLLDSDGNVLLDEFGYPLLISGPLLLPTIIGLAWPVDRSPTWDTLVQRAYGGKKTSIPRRSDAVYQYSIDINVLRIFSPGDYQNMVGFVNSLQGQFASFYFDDRNDDSVTDEIFGVGDGSSTTFQLVRAYNYTYDTVTMLRGPAPTIKANGVTLISGTNYSINNYGLVTFVVPPVLHAVLQWTGGFYWLCQFNIDKFDFSEFAYQFFELKKLTFETILL